MKEYLTVFEQNPRYENAISSYNRLAGQHAQKIRTQIAASVDATTSSNTSQIEFETPLGSVFSLKARYAADHKKLHTPPSLSLPESVSIHSINMELPANLGGIGVTLYGLAGGTVQNKLENLLPADVSLLTMDTLSDYFVVAPRLGAGIRYSLDAFSLSGEYRFNQLDTTFYAGRKPFYAHMGGISASYYKDDPARSFARTISGRVAGSLSSIYSVLDDATDNMLTALDAELHLGNQLADDPQASLDLGFAFAWRDSDLPGASDYYAPLKVLTIKGGPAGTILFGPEASTGISLEARFWPGYYASDGIGRLSLDGSLSLGVVRHGLNLYLNLGGAYTDSTDTAAAWWSGSATIGANISLGDYIIP